MRTALLTVAILAAVIAAIDLKTKRPRSWETVAWPLFTAYEIFRQMP